MFLFFQGKYVSEEVTHKDGGPLMMNAFEMITLSQGLDLSALFDRQQVICNKPPYIYWLIERGTIPPMDWLDLEN